MPNKSSEYGGAIWEHVVSSGTLRTQDLLRTFADEYARILPFNSSRRVNEARDLAERLDNDDAYNDVALQEEAGEAVNELQDAINECAAREGLYFGANEGDGACFSYWAIEADEEA